MSLFAGLEKFGFSEDDIKELDKQPEKKRAQQKAVQEKVELQEKDYLLDKTVQCPVCGKSLHTLILKTGRAKRNEPDFHLRPNFEGVDSIKYDCTLCPHCGYAAMNRFFNHIATAQARLVRENITTKFHPMPDKQEETYTYEQAIERYKLSMVSTIVKRGKLSERSYTALKIAWLIREQLKEIPEDNNPNNIQKQAALKEEYDAFYRQAYEGFQQALSTEMPPYCGMDTSTLEFMLANMAFHYKEYDTATKLVGTLITGSGVSSRIKDKALDLKEEILKEVKASKQ